MKRILFLLALSLPALMATAQKKKSPAPAAPPAGLEQLYGSLQYRSIGPYRGGRSAAVAGSYKSRTTFYMGATGGGVWKTTDGGSNWKNVSDGFFGGSIGAVAIAPSDESIVYVGEGENTMRGNVSEGLGGMWRSEDGGRSWKNIGLRDGRHIIRIVIHPRNPDVVWVAVVGHLFGPNEERGVYKTTDGGKTWKRTLYVNNQTGASDLVMEPGNPAVLYAGMWRVLRTPHSLESGGEGSGLYKSTDGGETWTNVSAKKGLPKGVWGIVGVAFAPSNTERIYALVENANGGLYRSDDAGENWQLMSNDNNIRQRAWYYTKVFVDPKNADVVYCPNVDFMRSRDGGRTFQSIRTPHGDHHDLWIDPEDSNRMIVADDGGAQVSFDGGSSWSTYMNQPTAQFYRVSTDNSVPYRILGAQQDNSTIRIRSRTNGAGITEQDWQPTAGSESGYVVADPSNPEIVYGGNYGGYPSPLLHPSREKPPLTAKPHKPMGPRAPELLQPRICGRGKLGRFPPPPRSPYRRKPRHQRMARQSHGRRGRCAQIPLSVELSHLLLPAQPQTALCGRQRVVCNGERRTELDRPRRRPHHQRQEPPAVERRSHHQRQYQRGVLLHHLHCHRIAAGERPVVDRQR
mgnify:CR=1 FL=1